VPGELAGETKVGAGERRERRGREVRSREAMGRKTREEKDYVFQPETWDNRIRFGTSLGVN
jgi:hypothetical protein